MSSWKWSDVELARLLSNPDSLPGRAMAAVVSAQVEAAIAAAGGTVGSGGTGTTGGTGGTTGGTGGGTTTGPVAADNFNRTDNTALGSTPTGSFAWQTTSTGWAIASNQLAYTGATDNVALVNAGISDNWTLSVKLVLAPATFPLVFAYGSSVSNFGKVYYGNGAWTLQGLSGGETLAGTTAPVAGNTATLTKTGSTLTVKLDGVAVSRYTGVTEHNTAGDTWLGVMGVAHLPFTIDDFAITTA